MGWYRTGTVDVTTGSVDVFGTDTLFLSQVREGQTFVGPDGVFYEIQNVVTDTHLQLHFSKPYAGPDATGAGYSVIRTGERLTSTDLITNLSSHVAYHKQLLDDQQAWHSQLGTISVYNPHDGSSVDVKTWPQIQSEMIQHGIDMDTGAFAFGDQNDSYWDMFVSHDSHVGNWYNLVEVTLENGSYKACVIEVEVTDPRSNYGHAPDLIVDQFSISLVRSAGTEDDTQSAYITGSREGVFRVERTAFDTFVIQFSPRENYRHYNLNYRIVSKAGASVSWLKGADRIPAEGAGEIFDTLNDYKGNTVYRTERFGAVTTLGNIQAEGDVILGTNGSSYVQGRTTGGTYSILGVNASNITEVGHPSLNTILRSKDVPSWYDGTDTFAFVHTGGGQIVDGTLEATTLRENGEDLFDIYVPRSEKGVASGVATLDAGGLIPASQIPPIAITNTFVVNSEAEMIALDAQRGDVAVRMDLAESYILATDDATIATNWQEIVTPEAYVKTVNGYTQSIVTLDYGDFAGGQHIDLQNNISVNGENAAGGTFSNLLKRDTSDRTIVGTTSYGMRLHSSSVPQWYTTAGVTYDLISTQGGQTINGTFSTTGNVDLASHLTLTSNDFRIKGIANDDVTQVDVARVSAANNVLFGDIDYSFVAQSSQTPRWHNGDDFKDLIHDAGGQSINGSLTINDRLLANNITLNNPGIGNYSEINFAANSDSASIRMANVENDHTEMQFRMSDNPDNDSDKFNWFIRSWQGEHFNWKPLEFKGYKAYINSIDTYFDGRLHIGNAPYYFYDTEKGVYKAADGNTGDLALEIDVSGYTIGSKRGVVIHFTDANTFDVLPRDPDHSTTPTPTSTGNTMTVGEWVDIDYGIKVRFSGTAAVAGDTYAFGVGPAGHIYVDNGSITNVKAFDGTDTIAWYRDVNDVIRFGDQNYETRLVGSSTKVADGDIAYDILHVGGGQSIAGLTTFDDIDYTGKLSYSGGANMVISNEVPGTDIRIMAQGADGSSYVGVLVNSVGNNVEGVLSHNGNFRVTAAANGAEVFGADNQVDFSLTHDGSNAYFSNVREGTFYVSNAVNAGDLVLRGRTDAGTNYDAVRVAAGSSVYPIFYHNGNVKAQVFSGALSLYQANLDLQNGFGVRGEDTSGTKYNILTLGGSDWVDVGVAGYQMQLRSNDTIKYHNGDVTEDLVHTGGLQTIKDTTTFGGQVALHLNHNESEIHFEANSSRRITNNDGNGNWNFWAGGYSDSADGLEKYIGAAAGAAKITFTHESQDGKIVLKTAPAAANAGDTIAWGTELALKNDMVQVLNGMLDIEGRLQFKSMRTIGPLNGTQKTYASIENVTSGENLAFLMHGDDTTDRMSFMTAYNGASSFTERMSIIAETGYVGINNTAPTAQLDVTGSAKVSGSIGIDTEVNISQGDTNSLRITTANGWVDIGSDTGSSNLAHFRTDRDRFWFNEAISVNGDINTYNGGVNHKIADNTGSLFYQGQNTDERYTAKIRNYSRTETILPADIATEGWYRVARASGTVSGTLLVRAGGDNTQQELEVDIDFSGYNVGGSVAIVRNLEYNDGPIKNIKVSSEFSAHGGATGDIYIDLYLTGVVSGATLAFEGFKTDITFYPTPAIATTEGTKVVNLSTGSAYHNTRQFANTDSTQPNIRASGIIQADSFRSLTGLELMHEESGVATVPNVLRVSSGTSGDATLLVEADTDNNNEEDNPVILLRQDAGQVEATLGLNSINDIYLNHELNGATVNVFKASTAGKVTFASLPKYNTYDLLHSGGGQTIAGATRINGELIADSYVRANSGLLLNVNGTTSRLLGTDSSGGTLDLAYVGTLDVAVLGDQSYDTWLRGSELVYDKDGSQHDILHDGNLADKFIARRVMKTANGTSSDSGYWSHLLTVNMGTMNHADGSILLYIVNEETSSIGEALVSIKIRQSTVGTNDTLRIDWLGNSGTVFDRDAFRLVSEGHGSDKQLWVRKTGSYNMLAVYEQARNVEDGGTITYHNGSVWVADAPTGTSQRDSGEFEFNENEVYHAGNKMDHLPAYGTNGDNFRVSNFDIQFGYEDQVTRGDSGVSRAMVKQNGYLELNHSADFGDLHLTGDQEVVVQAPLLKTKGKVRAEAGGEALQIKAESQDHAYLGFYARTADTSARSAWLGFGTAGSVDLTLRNHLAGNLLLTPGGSGSVVVEGGLSVNGSLVIGTDAGDGDGRMLSESGNGQYIHFHGDETTAFIPQTTTTASNATLGIPSYRWSTLYVGDINATGTVMVNGSEVITGMDGKAPDSDLLDGIEADQFIRSDVNDVVTANTVWGDGYQVTFGTDSDMHIQHTGLHGNIVNTTGDLTLEGRNGPVIIRTGATPVNVISANNGAAILFKDGNAKLNTVDTGVDVDGDVTTTGKLKSESGEVELAAAASVKYDSVTDSIDFVFA